MDTREAFLVDAFATEPTDGNPAGVVPDADGLDAEQMQAIASELGASETAFVQSSTEADRRLRYFTPETEVDLCGHATIASHALLFERDHVDSGSHTIETAVGTLVVTIEADGTVWMGQSAPTIRPVECDYDRVAGALGVDPAALEDVGADLPMVVASTGVPFLLVPVNYFQHLSGATPDQSAIETLCREVDAEGLYAFTFDTLEADATLHGRAFAPLDGIPEDPVTGTASGAVGAYLDREGALDADRSEIVCEQGHFLDRPGRVRVELDPELRVGGRAVTTLEGELLVPETDDEEIIEV